MRARRPWVEVEITPGSRSAWVRGSNAKQLVERAGGRPIWSPQRRAWNTRSDVGRDVLALAEVEGFAVAFSEGGGPDDAA